MRLRAPLRVAGRLPWLVGLQVGRIAALVCTLTGWPPRVLENSVGRKGQSNAASADRHCRRLRPGRRFHTFPEELFLPFWICALDFAFHIGRRRYKSQLPLTRALAAGSFRPTPSSFPTFFSDPHSPTWPGPRRERRREDGGGEGRGSFLPARWTIFGQWSRTNGGGVMLWSWVGAMFCCLGVSNDRIATPLDDSRSVL